MISLIQILAAGNALRVVLTPPPGTASIRLLRKDADTFTGEDDPTALLVSDTLDRAVTDAAGLINGEEVFYRAYYLVDDVWQASATKSAVPEATYQTLGPDVLELVRSRLEAGLKVSVDRGKIRHARGYIPVLNASPQVEEVELPLVTVHLGNDSPDIRSLGEMVIPDMYIPEDDVWDSFEGAYGRTDLTIVGWSVNSDERINLRKAIKSTLLANLPVFASHGLIQPEWSFSDTEDFVQYAVPMYQVMCQFKTFAPDIVVWPDEPIRIVNSTLVT